MHNYRSTFIHAPGLLVLKSGRFVFNIVLSILRRSWESCCCNDADMMGCWVLCTCVGFGLLSIFALYCLSADVSSVADNVGSR